MKLINLWLSAALLLSPIVWAKSDLAILKEAKQNRVSIAAAQKLKDETGVTLKGEIVRQLVAQGDEFELKDKTGSIIIDVDDEAWQRLGLKAGDQVEVVGEVDTHRRKPTDIDVIEIQKLP